MNITIKKETLKEKLDVASNFVGSGRTDLEITKSVLLTATEDGALIVDASNFLKGCKLRIPDVEVKEKGQITLEFKSFFKLIKALTAEKLNFNVKGGNIKLRELDANNLNTFTIPLVDGPDKFPRMPLPGKDSTKYEIEKEKLLETVKKVRFAAEDPKRDDPNVKEYSKMIFFFEDLVYATNTQKIGAILDPEIKVSGFYLPKDSISLFNDLSNNITIYLENNIFYIEDENLFFAIRQEVVNPPTGRVREILNTPKKIAVSYEPDEDELKDLINTLNQFKIFNDSVVVYTTKESMWLAGVDYSRSEMSSFHSSLKRLNIFPKEFNREVAVTFSIRNLLHTLRNVEKPEIIFQGGYTDNDGFLRVYDDEFQGVVQRLVKRFEENLMEEVKAGRLF